MNKLLLISLVISFTICSKSWAEDNEIKIDEIKIDTDFLKPKIIYKHVEPINEAIERAKKQKNKDINLDIDKDINKEIYEGLESLTPPTKINSPSFVEKHSKSIVIFSVLLIFFIHRVFLADRKKDGKTWDQAVLEAKQKKKEKKNNINVINQIYYFIANKFTSIFITTFFLFFLFTVSFLIIEGTPQLEYQFEKNIDRCISDGVMRKNQMESHYFMADRFKEQSKILEPGKKKNSYLETSIGYIERAKKLENISDLDYCVKKYYQIIKYTKTYNYKINNFLFKRDKDYWDNIIIEKYYK